MRVRQRSQAPEEETVMGNDLQQELEKRRDDAAERMTMNDSVLNNLRVGVRWRSWYCVSKWYDWITERNYYQAAGERHAYNVALKLIRAGAGDGD
jgi:hypothetical protein